MREQLLYYAIKYQGDYRRIGKALLANEKWERISYDGNFITLLDDEYPNKLLNLRYKPWVLFYEGNLDLLNKDMIGVIGSREMSIYGQECVKSLLLHLKKKYGVISGMAKGIDGLSHQEALLHNRSSIGVIGCGINVIYPKEHHILYENMKNMGLLISEYPKDTKPLAHHFPWRNRLIAALSNSLIVVEARIRSGTMITVNEALELGKDIYCFPHQFADPKGEGCNQLIQQGCGMLNNREDIKEI